MNLALRVVHEALTEAGAPKERWNAVFRAIAARCGREGHVQREDVAAALQWEGIKGPIGEWMVNLRRLGVLDEVDRLDQRRSDRVEEALELVGDSFAPLGLVSSYALVATVPADLRGLLHPPLVRQTAGVLLELIDEAAAEVVLASPFVDEAAVRFTSDALLGAGRRGARVRIITSLGTGGLFADLGRRWAGEASGSLVVSEVATHLSSLGSHAKVLVVDGSHGYIGSANLTGAGLSRHVEIGVEVKGPQVADLAELLCALERMGVRVLEVAGGRTG